MKNSISAKIILIFLTIIIYSPTLWNGFQLEWDDGVYIIENPYVYNPSLSKIKELFTSSYFTQYAPLNTLYYICIKSIFGFNALVFHIINLIIHVLNVLLVYSITKLILKKIKKNYSNKRITLFSFSTALIFAIHPLQVESIAWISASKIPFYSLFYLMAVMIYVRYLEAYNTFKVIIILLLMLVSFGFKEQGIILPLSFLCIDIAFSRIKWNFNSIYTIGFIEKIPYLGLSLVLWFFSAQIGIGNLSDSSFPLEYRLVFGAQSLSEYIFRFFAPIKMYYFYYYPIEPGDKLPLLNLIYILTAAIIVLYVAYIFKKKNKILILGSSFFLVNIFLVLHLIPIPRKFITADRYIYIAIFGLSIMLTYYIQFCYIKFKFRRNIIIGLVVCIFLGLGVRTFTRCYDWNNSEILKSNLRKNIEKSI